MSSCAWIEGAEEIKDVDKVFEDNFVSSKSGFQKLGDSGEYLQILGISSFYTNFYQLLINFCSTESRLRKIKKDPSVLQQLKEKREECLNNLINDSHSFRSEQDFQLDESVTPNEIVRHLIPEQAQTAGEVAHLIRYDLLDQQKQEDEESDPEVAEVQAKE